MNAVDNYPALAAVARAMTQSGGTRFRSEEEVETALSVVTLMHPTEAMVAEATCDRLISQDPDVTAWLAGEEDGDDRERPDISGPTNFILEAIYEAAE